MKSWEIFAIGAMFAVTNCYITHYGAWTKKELEIIKIEIKQIYNDLIFEE